MNNDVSIAGSRLINISDRRLSPLSKLVVKSPDCQPAIWKFSDVLAVPGKTGLYDCTGFRIDESTWKFQTNQALLSESVKLKIARALEKGNPANVDVSALLRKYGKFDQNDETVLFLGGINCHYGHWLIDFTSRLWAANLPQSPASRFMLPAPWAFRERTPYEVSYMTPFFDWAHLNCEQVNGIDRPTIFREVVIPEPSLQNIQVIFSAADTSHIGVADSIKFDREAYHGKKIYLSRKKVISDIKKVVGEDIVEIYFARLGFDIIYPEELSFIDQISLFNSAEIIAGFAGSAFHTGMLSTPLFKGTLLIICGDEMINTRFVLQGAIKSYSTILLRGYDWINRTCDGELPIMRANIDLLKSGLRIIGL